MQNSSIIDKINYYKKKYNAIVLAHNYQPGEIQDIADITGDSFGLSNIAAETKCDTIVFCGVYFMAETAHILSPQKTVLLPVLEAGCPMADMITAEQLKKLKSDHPQAVVVTYVNSSAEIKALSDICCTSANAVSIVKQIPEDKNIIFLPDQNLGQYIATKLNRKIILHNGYCPTHHKILPEHVKRAKNNHPDALTAIHPECRPEVLKLADFVGSTSQILKYCQTSAHNQFIIGTENGILHTLKTENPNKKFYPISEHMVCPNMKKTNLENLLWSLEDKKHVITIEKNIRENALSAITKMLEII